MNRTFRDKIVANRLFADLGTDQIRQIAADKFAVRQFQPGEYILEQDKPNHEIFLITSGTVRILVRDKDGPEIEIARRGENDFMGEVSLIDHQHPSASVCCETAVEALCLKTEDFFLLADRFPQLKMAMARNIGSRLRQATDATVANIKIAGTLLQLTQTILHQRNHLESYSQDLETALDKLEQRNSQLYRLATTDGLTQVHNRGFVLEMLEKELANSSRNRLPLSCLLIDLDNLKQINDRHGHLAGDFALQRTAQMLRENLRQADTIGRYGGDEFLVLLPGTAVSQAAVLADKLIQKVARKKCPFKNLLLHVTLSIGISDNDSERPLSLDELLNRADKALYAAKQKGKNRVDLFPAASNRRFRHPMSNRV